MAEKRSGSRADTLVRLLMMAMITLFSFSVGTFFGKRTAEKASQMAAYEANSEQEEGGDRETASIPPGSLDVKPEDALSEEELSKLSEEHSMAEKVGHENGEDVAEGSPHGSEKRSASKESGKEPSSKKHAAEEKVVAHEKQNEKLTEKKVPEQFKRVQAAAERVAHGQEPTVPETKEKVRTPSSLPSQVASSAIGKFTVQVSSHQVESEASKRAEELKARGFSAFYVKAKINGKLWYRVSVGLFTTRKEAVDYVAVLKQDAKVQAAIVQKIVE